MKITINFSKWTFGTILVILAGILISLYIQSDETKTPSQESLNLIQAEDNQSQRFIRQDSYPVPELVKIDISSYKNGSFETLEDRFRPIGWSSNGKFAYVIEPADEACGCYFFNIYIQDLTTDKILWKWEYNSDSGDSGNTENNVDKVWKKMNALFTQQLNNHEINPISNKTLQTIPVIQENNNYEFPIINKELSNPMVGGNAYAQTSIYLNRNGKRIMKIYDHQEDNFSSNPNETTSPIMANKIMGYLKSPFENRIAILYSALKRGYEGPPNIVNLNIIGCNLDYKKNNSKKK